MKHNFDVFSNICRLQMLSIWTSLCRLLTLSQTGPGFYASALQVFWKHCGKRRNCSVFFPQRFLSIWITFFHFHQIQNCRLQTLSVWKSLKFVVWERVKGLKSLSQGQRFVLWFKVTDEMERSLEKEQGWKNVLLELSSKYMHLLNLN